jgi:glycosyltransferase involved in cell wall biosynthesis
VGPELGVLVTARDEADSIGETLAALSTVFPGARIVVADDASRDGTAEVARAAGAEVVSSTRGRGKGGAATLGAERLLGAPVVLLCDGDLGRSAAALPELVEAVESGRGDLAVASFARRVGGGFGLALGAARRVIRARTGLEPAAPVSGQRAMRGEVLRAVVPFAPRFGMETAMTIDAHRAGFRVVEVELDLEHRATGRTAAGFLHRARQLRDILRVYASRR